MRRVRLIEAMIPEWRSSGHIAGSVRERHTPILSLGAECRLGMAHGTGRVLLGSWGGTGDGGDAAREGFERPLHVFLN